MTGKASHDMERSGSYEPEMDDVNRMRYLLDLQNNFNPGGLSAEALANRLYALSPRIGLSSSSLLGEAMPNLPMEADSNGFESSESSHSDGRIFSPEETHSLKDVTPATNAITPCVGTASMGDTVPGLRDAIKGLFHLWAHSRNGRSNDGEPDKEEFLRIVHDSI